MKTKLLPAFLITSALLAGAFFTSADAALSVESRQENFSLSKKSLALDGYDPVSYFKGGPKEGSKKYAYKHEGVNYRFINKANLESFKSEPEKYEPQYGGWCAWAMYDGGGRTEPDPESYIIIDGKLFVFYKGFFGDTLKLWKEAAAKSSDRTLITVADKYWLRQVGK